MAARIVAAGTGQRPSGLGWPGAGTAVPQPPGGPAAEATLGFRLGRAHRLVRSAWEAEIADLGLSPPQALLLRAVAGRPGCGLRELARRIQTDAMNAKRLADHLDRAGLVRSQADPRHRQRRVLVPTGPGAALAGELDRRAAAYQQRLARRIGPAGMADLLALLDVVEAAAGAERAARSGVG